MSKKESSLTAKTLEKTYRVIPAGSTDEALLADDTSTDDTVMTARKQCAELLGTAHYPAEFISVPENWIFINFKKY